MEQADQAEVPTVKTSKSAIWSLICGIAGLILCLPSIPAVILGIIALVNINKAKGLLKGTGMAIAGLILAGLSVVVVPFIIGLVAAIVIPLSVSRQTVKETYPIQKAPEIKVETEPIKSVHKNWQDPIISGLIWLAKHQNPDGSWGAKSFQNQCKDTKCSGTGDEQFNIGLTGLSMLAFTGAGYTDSSRDTYDGICFGDVVKKASGYLISIQLSDGTFGGVKEGKFMYNQALATYAMADLCALAMDNPAGVIFREPVERATKYIVDAQNPGKGWRYQPKGGVNDTSVTGWVAMALKAAEGCNIPVPPESFAGIKSFYDDVTDKTYGKVGYTELGSLAVRGDEDQRLVNANTIQPCLTAIGIMVRISIDKKTTDPLIKLGVKQIISKLPTWDISNPCIIDYYYWFYGTKCLTAYDGPAGKNWNIWWKKIKDVLPKNQCTKEDGCADGSWDPIDRWGCEGGRVYSTTINILTLSSYFD